jgi:putative transposase
LRFHWGLSIKRTYCVRIGSLNEPFAAKNREISMARRETIGRHREMSCKTYELKLDKSHLSNENLHALHRLFLEAKWFYNAMLTSPGGPNAFDYKQKDVVVLNKKRGPEVRRIATLTSHMRQSIIDRAKQAIRGLAVQKKRHRVGALRFTSQISSIPLKQYGRTYDIRGERVKIQGIKQPLRVRGTDQIPEDAEFTSADLIFRSGDYFLHVTAYENPKTETSTKTPKKRAVGIDAGIRNQLTLSNGVIVNSDIDLPARRIGRLHRELSRRGLKRGKNWSKTKLKLDLTYNKTTNRRRDVKHKIVSCLTSNYDAIATQRDNVNWWQKMWGRRIASSAIGGITRDLRAKPHFPVAIERFVPTTKQCCECGKIRSVGLDERTYSCDTCGLVIDRDLNAATNMWLRIPAERRESTPANTKAATEEMIGYLNNIPFTSASRVEEAGSHQFKTGGSSRSAAPSSALLPRGVVGDRCRVLDPTDPEP